MDDLADVHGRNGIGTFAADVTHFVRPLCIAAPNKVAAAQTCPQAAPIRRKAERERIMDLGQLAILGICAVGILVALMAMAFYAQKNSAR
jgi:hypothetical protein